MRGNNVKFMEVENTEREWGGEGEGRAMPDKATDRGQKCSYVDYRQDKATQRNAGKAGGGGS